MKNRWAPHLIILAALLWSLDGFWRSHLYSLPPATVVFLEHLLGLIALSPFLIKEIKNWKKLSPTTWLSVLAIALFGGAIGTIAYTGALGKVNYISLSVVVLLQQLQPIFAIALAGLLLREKLTGRFIALAVLALAAAYFVTFPDLRVNLATSAGTVIAALLALAAAFSWGASTVFGRYALHSLSHVSLTGLRFSLTAVLIFVYLAARGQVSTLGTLTSGQWWYVLAIVFSTGLVALLIYYRGLSGVPARVSTLLELAWPLSAIMIDWFSFSKTLSPTQWLGTIVLLGVIVKLSRDFSKNNLPVEGPVS